MSGQAKRNKLNGLDIFNMLGLDLFSGIGGISLALREWVRPVIYCEINSYCQGVLLSRMADESLSNGPIWDDITTLSGLPFKGSIDIIFGGFPCQGISVAGHGKGLEDERSGLFFEILRLAKEIQPKFIFLENTKGILSNGGTEVINSLTSIGYNCRWITKSCKEVGSPQNRERWFCLAHLDSTGSPRLHFGEEEAQPKSKLYSEYTKQQPWPKNKSKLLGMDDVIPFRLDRAKSLGNSVCIKQTKEAFKELIGLN